MVFLPLANTDSGKQAGIFNTNCHRWYFRDRKRIYDEFGSSTLPCDAEPSLWMLKASRGHDSNLDYFLAAANLNDA
jgi:hypothetical protein